MLSKMSKQRAVLFQDETVTSMMLVRLMNSKYHIRCLWAIVVKCGLMTQLANLEILCTFV